MLVVGRSSFRAGTLSTLGATLAFFGAWHGLRIDQSPERLLSAALAGRLPAPAVAEGMVTDNPATSDSNPNRATMTIRLMRLDAAGIVSHLPARVKVAWEGELPRYGDRVRLSGRIENIPAARNPEEFDSARFHAGQGIFHQIILKHSWEGEIISGGHGHPLVSLTIAARQWMLHALSLGIEDSPEVIGVIGGMVLGAKDDQSAEMRRMFRETGTLHLFAVSGLHVWMFGLLAWMVLGTFLPRKGSALAILVVLLLFYAAVTGLRPSVVRATIMAVVVLGTLLVERPAMMPNSLAASAVLILGMDPRQLFDLGFQLSFCVVGALSVLTPPIHRLLGDWWVPDPFIPKKLLSPVERIWQSLGGKVTALIAVTFASWLGSLPLIYAHFHLLSPVALAANMVAVIIGFGVLAIGLLGILLAILAPPLAALANNANWLAASLLLLVVKLAWHVPGGYFYLAPPGPPGTSVTATIFDFGSGAAVHVESGRLHALLDAGSQADVENVLAPYLRSRGVRVLEEIILTHGDAQHVGGIPVILEQFRARSLSQPMTLDRSSSRRRALASARERGVPAQGRVAGDTIRLKPGVRLDVLDPPGLLATRKADDAPLVVQMQAEGWKLLYLGDAGFPTFQRLAADQQGQAVHTHCGSLQSDVVVLGWDSDDTHGCLEFLITQAQPRLVVLGRNPFAKDPGAADQLKAALEARGIHVSDQRSSGAVTLHFSRDFLRAEEKFSGRSFTMHPLPPGD